MPGHPGSNAARPPLRHTVEAFGLSRAKRGSIRPGFTVLRYTPRSLDSVVVFRSDVRFYVAVTQPCCTARRRDSPVPVW